MTKNNSQVRRQLSRFWSLLGKGRVAIIVSIVLAVGAAVCSLFGPKLLGQMTNEAYAAVMKVGGVEAGGEAIMQAIDWGKLGGVAITLIVLYIISAALSYLEYIVLWIATEKFAERVRGEIVAKIARLPMKYFDQHQVGDVLSRMSNDAWTMSGNMANVLSQTITAVTTIIGILIMMMTISVWLSLIALVVVPVSLVFIRFVARRAQKLFRQQQVVLGDLNSEIEESYSGQTLIKANLYEEKAIKKFATTNEKFYNTAWRAQFYSSLAFPITHVFTNLNYVLICMVGGRLAIDGKLLIGSVQAFIQYVSQFNRPITEVAQISSNIQQTLAAAGRVFEFLDEPEEPVDYQPAQEVKKIQGAVEFHQVSFSYDGDKPTIRNFSVKIKPGMRVAIVGPTGAGKTTIINLLMRFYEPDSGYITVDGVPIAEMRRADVRRMFGMVLQDTWLFSGTIEENLKYGRPDVTEEGIRKAAKIAHVHHFIESLSRGYKTEISEDSDNISAGEKQLLTIVRAMVADSPMMILDEATSNVDTRTEQLIQEAFIKLTKGRTSFVIAHRLSTIRDSDLILVMRGGEIVEQGTHNTLLKRGGYYAELYNSQFEE